MVRTSTGRCGGVRALALGIVCGIAALVAGGASAAGLNGRVLDVFGMPMEGVPLSVRTAPTAPTGERLRTTDTAHETASNADGRYTVAGLADATYEVAIANTRLGPGTRYDIVGARVRGVTIAVDGGPLVLGLDGVVTDVDAIVAPVAVFPTAERVDVRVTLADGSEGVNAKVSYKVVEGTTSVSHRLTADERGRCGFTLGEAADGRLTASLDGQSASMRVRIEENAPSRGPLRLTLSGAPDWPIDGS